MDVCLAECHLFILLTLHPCCHFRKYQFVALTGMPGTGKTKLAREAFFKHAQHVPAGIKARVDDMRTQQRIFTIDFSVAPPSPSELQGVQNLFAMRLLYEFIVKHDKLPPTITGFDSFVINSEFLTGFDHEVALGRVIDYINQRTRTRNHDRIHAGKPPMYVINIDEANILLKIKGGTAYLKSILRDLRSVVLSRKASILVVVIGNMAIIDKMFNCRSPFRSERISILIS